MEWVETTGRTVAAALDAALDELGVDERDVDYEVVSEPRGGLLGRFGGGEARVRARVKPLSREKPGDHQPRSRRGGPGSRAPGSFFSERPPHVSSVLDALLADPAWKDRIATDAQGPRIGVLGHSAGGYTAIALAGGRPDMTLIAAHCRADRAADPLFCSRVSDGPSPAPRPIPPMTDRRVRAVMALAPVVP